MEIERKWLPVSVLDVSKLLEHYVTKQFSNTIDRTILSGYTYTCTKRFPKIYIEDFS